MHEPPGPPVMVTRDCAATLIPSGKKIVLLYGTTVSVMQAHGGNVTVRLDQGQLAHLDARNAEALDLPSRHAAEGAGTSNQPPSASTPHPTVTAQGVLEQLKTIFDPEIPVNIVDLGLIYDCEAIALPSGHYRVAIQMSMTAPGCGMGDVLRAEAQTTVQAMPGVSEVTVEVVWDPPWNPQRMSMAARLQLGML